MKRCLGRMVAAMLTANSVAQAQGPPSEVVRLAHAGTPQELIRSEQHNFHWGIGAVYIAPAPRSSLAGAPSFLGPYVEGGVTGLLGGIAGGHVRLGYGLPLQASDSTLRESSAPTLTVDIFVGPSGSWGALEAGVGLGQVFFPDSTRLLSNSISTLFFVGAEITLARPARLALGAEYIPRQYIARSSRVAAVTAALGLRFR